MVETDPDKVLAMFGFKGNVAAMMMIVFGILVILFPELISIIIGIYLIVHGLISLDSNTSTSRYTRKRPRYDDPYYRGHRQRRDDRYRDRERHRRDDRFHDGERLERDDPQDTDRSKNENDRRNADQLKQDEM